MNRRSQESRFKTDVYLCNKRGPGGVFTDTVAHSTREDLEVFSQFDEEAGKLRYQLVRNQQAVPEKIEMMLSKQICQGLESCIEKWKNETLRAEGDS